MPRGANRGEVCVFFAGARPFRRPGLHSPTQWHRSRAWTPQVYLSTLPAGTGGRYLVETNQYPANKHLGTCHKHLGTATQGNRRRTSPASDTAAASDDAFVASEARGEAGADASGTATAEPAKESDEDDAAPVAADADEAWSTRPWSRQAKPAATSPGATKDRPCQEGVGRQG